MAKLKPETVIVAAIQDRFTDAGWRWTEETFDDGDVVIRFTLSKNCHAFSDPEMYEARKFGWGRFQRAHAWMQAEAFLLDGISTDRNALAELNSYIHRWGRE